MISHSPSLKSRVALVVNSDAPLSGQVADYYIAKRGLEPHKITLALGTAMKLSNAVGDAALANIITPIADYCEANDIKVLLCSAAVPEFLNTLPNTSAQRYDYSFSSLVAMSRIFKATGVMPTRVESPSTGGHLQMVKTAAVALIEWGSNIVPISSHADEPNYSVAISAERETIRVPNWEDVRTAPVVPTNMISLFMCGGRIGYPGGYQDNNAVGQTNFTTAETFDETKRIIDDAVDTEGTTGPIHFGIGDYGSASEPDGIEFSRRQASAAGYDVRHSKNSSSVTLAVPPNTYNTAAFLAGTLNPQQPMWGYYGNLVVNKGIADPWINSVVLQRGAWGYHWCSYSMTHAYQMLKAGGCCAVGTWPEPWKQGLVKPVTLFSSLLKGLCMSEAVFAFGNAQQAWCMTVWGDPLYRPFANRKPPGGFAVGRRAQL